LETLEHVFDVRRAVDELMRVLAPGGILLVSVPFYFRIHAYPSDYWRITPQCLAGLLAPLDARLVGYQGSVKHPHTVFGLAAKQPLAPDFGSRKRAFVYDFQQRLTQVAQSRSPWRRWEERVRGLFVSKGERRRRRCQYQCHFELDADSPPNLTTGASPCGVPVESMLV
jgi:SAM-dependent methyltransferase